MKVLIVRAHPEPKSLNGSLFRVAIDELQAQGHELQVSDLYAFKWKPQIDRVDFPHLSSEDRLIVVAASAKGYESGALTDDVKAEQAKLVWADAVVLLFPLWWFSMPAILKGWFERVYSAGHAYGIGAKRYGEGIFEGKRAMLAADARSFSNDANCLSPSGCWGLWNTLDDTKGGC
ncbi:NAD(P)H dehydrogenase (quinone) [Diaporthe helianthi]|uniref:NAD(P)H dehydrogenase (Quinone) n=1 Tax=Diaporthe helianthi TaxID=158607 RepID=A0A2P5HE57_DIAHE|nr:NAD(P)H dehydrogenase (quinone) [Diaporthe helianthi]